MKDEKKLLIHHHTLYTYQEQVFLNPHKILLSPSNRRYFHIHSIETDIHPAPLGVNQRLDMEGNLFQQVWFGMPTTRFEIDIKLDLTVYPINPFEFIITENFEQLNPHGELIFNYSEEQLPFLQPFLQHSPSPFINGFAKDIKQGSNGIVTFLVELTAHLHRICNYITREAPGIWSPEKTLSEQRGSCRDLAWLLINILRGEGIASRFVSGYAYNPELEENHELHAWVEAFCPGAGWIGIDPSLGLLTDAFYIPLASSYLPHLTLPVSGTYSGNGSSQLSSFVEIKPV
ncbi:hypothetical protein GCM10028791_20210 [Echinicola sediminis]